MDHLKIIIADDNSKFREGLKFYLEKVLNYKVLDEVDSGEAFLNLENSFLADIILMDISMPNINGILAAKTYLNNHQGKIIAITSYEEKTYLNELIEAGIKGCVYKKDIYEHLNPAIKRVMHNDLYFPKNINLK